MAVVERAVRQLVERSRSAVDRARSAMPRPAVDISMTPTASTRRWGQRRMQSESPGTWRCQPLTHDMTETDQPRSK